MGPKFRRIELGVRKRLPVYDDLSRLNRFQPIDTTDECALAATTGPAYHYDFASVYFKVYGFEDVERAEPLVYIVKFDHGKNLICIITIAKYRFAYYMNKGFLQHTRTHFVYNISIGRTGFWPASEFSVKVHLAK